MKNPIKKYFLFFSQCPVWFSLAPWGIMFLLLVAFMIIGAMIVGADTMEKILEDFFTLMKIPLLIFLGATIGHIFLIYWVINKYVTLPEDVCLCHLLVSDDGRDKMIVEAPVWAKGRNYYIEKYQRSRWSSREKYFCVSTTIQGGYKNALVEIPVKLELELNGEFNFIKVFEELIKSQKQSECLSIEKYIIDVFEKMNQKGQDKINQAVGEYAETKISEPALLARIIEELIFPENLFSNVKDTKICLGDPVASACKGMACSSNG